MRANPVVLGFIRKEMIQTWREKRLRMILFVMPVIQLTLFGLAISTETRNVKLAAVYKPEDTLCRRIEEHCYGSGWFIPATRREGDPFKLIQTGAADAVLLAPEGGLNRALGRGDGRIQLLVDAANIVKAQSIESYIQAIANQVAAEKQGSAPTPPVSFSVRYLYNPEMETPLFMVPGVLCMILVIITIIITGAAISREKELGTFETLIASPAKVYEILLGKTVPFMIIGMVDMLLVLAVAVFGFRIPMRGPLWMLLVASLAFVCNTVSLGVLLSTFTRNMRQTAMGGFLFIFPALQLSGLIFPVENMPWMLKPVAYLDPLMYFVALLRNIMLKGGDPGLVLINVGALCLMAVFAVTLSASRFRQTLN